MGSSGPPPAWIDTAVAAQIIGVSQASVDRWARLGVFRRRFEGRRIVVRSDEVDAMAAERRRWISEADAAALVGCTVHQIKNAVREGRIAVRTGVARRVPKLSRASVERFSREWQQMLAEARVAAERARRARERVAHERALRNGPPSDDVDWLTVQQAADVLGVSCNRVTQLARADRIPATKVGDRWWFRRLHMEQAARARHFRNEGRG